MKAKNKNNEQCICDPISGVCKYITASKKNESKIYSIFKVSNSILETPLKTSEKIIVRTEDDKIIFKNVLAFRGDYENKNGIVYDQNMVKGAVEQYKNIIKKFPYFRYMFDGHVDNYDAQVVDSFKNIIGYVLDIRTEEKYKAVFIDFVVFKAHPTGKIIEQCVKENLPVGVSVVISSTDVYKLSRTEIKELNPDVKLLSDMYPDLAQYYMYKLPSEILFYTGEGFITRIDVVFKPALETHTFTQEQSGVIYNSEKLALIPTKETLVEKPIKIKSYKTTVDEALETIKALMGKLLVLKNEQLDKESRNPKKYIFASQTLDIISFLAALSETMQLLNTTEPGKILKQSTVYEKARPIFMYMGQIIMKKRKPFTDDVKDEFPLDEKELEALKFINDIRDILTNFKDIIQDPYYTPKQYRFKTVINTLKLFREKLDKYASRIIKEQESRLANENKKAVLNLIKHDIDFKLDILYEGFAFVYSFVIEALYDLKLLDLYIQETPEKAIGLREQFKDIQENFQTKMYYYEIDDIYPTRQEKLIALTIFQDFIPYISNSVLLNKNKTNIFSFLKNVNNNKTLQPFNKEIIPIVYTSNVFSKAAEKHKTQLLKLPKIKRITTF